MADVSDSRTKPSRTLLFAPCAFNLAETSRMLEIALGVARDPVASKVFQSHFISDGGDFEPLIEKRRRHRWRQRHRPRHVRALRRRGRQVAVVDLDEEAGGEVAAAVDGMFVRADVTSSDEVEALYGEVAARFGGIDVCCNNAGISPPDDDSILDTGLDAWDRVPAGQPHVGVSLLQARPPAPARPRQGIDHQHRVVRRRHGCGDQPDQLHGVQGRCARHVARARRAVRPPGGAGERAVPGAGQHPVARGALRHGSRARRAATGAHPHGPLRRGRRDRGGGGVPRLGRLARSSQRRPSSSTAESPGPTSRRCRRPAPGGSRPERSATDHNGSMETAGSG